MTTKFARSLTKLEVLIELVQVCKQPGGKGRRG